MSSDRRRRRRTHKHAQKRKHSLFATILCTEITYVARRDSTFWLSKMQGEGCLGSSGCNAADSAKGSAETQRDAS